MNPENVTRYLRTDEVADLLRCSPRTIRRLIEEGEIEAFRVGKRRLLVTWQSVGAYIRRGVDKMAGAIVE